MLIDHVTIKVRAGNGGKGAVAFSNIKMTLGPTGGSGGRGGDIYLEAVADLGALRRFRAQKSFAAEDGMHGRQSFRDGHVGADLVLKVPRGTVAKNIETGVLFELTKLGERVGVAQGGKGGKGNFQYKSSRNTSPKQSQPGLPGETVTLELELKLIADVGLIGLPNIGKSSFLNEVTNAQSRVANYEFTTLEPHLGAYEGLILADIPGLIEGASSGKGLGIRFLRHIERTRILFHFIDAGSSDPVKDYKTIRAELGTYNKKLLEKTEYVIIARSDTVDESRLALIKKSLRSTKREILSISIYNPEEMQRIRVVLNEILKDLEIPKTA
jgi:GTP-binding protein